MRSRDWSSDVCSSDLILRLGAQQVGAGQAGAGPGRHEHRPFDRVGAAFAAAGPHQVREHTADPEVGLSSAERVKGTRVSVRVDLGGTQILKKKNMNKLSN